MSYGKEGKNICWICGELATTNEHIVKASDVRGYFGEVSPSRPVYRNNNQITNKKVQSAKSKLLTFEKTKLCASCNNERTQPFDKAWETLSEYLRGNWIYVKKHKKLNLGKVYKGKKSNAIYLQLYFVKLFGCMAKEYEIPFEYDLVSRSLLERLPIKRVYLVFGETPAQMVRKFAMLTPVYTYGSSTKLISAVWIYTLGELSVKVMYTINAGDHKPVQGMWHPSKNSKILKLGPI